MAQSDGIVTELLVLKGQLVARGAVVAIVEADAAREARGWLDPSMAAAVYPGMAVAVEVASAQGPRTLRGEIEAVEAGIAPEISPDFGMLVRVRFPDLSTDDTRRQLPHLAPVKLAAQRPWARKQVERWAALGDRLGF